jgi:hypothetical protein
MNRADETMGYSYSTGTSFQVVVDDGRRLSEWPRMSGTSTYSSPRAAVDAVLSLMDSSYEGTPEVRQGQMALGISFPSEGAYSALYCQVVPA